VTQADPTRARLRPEGTLLSCAEIDIKSLPTPKALNVAMLGMLSTHLDLAAESWRDAICGAFPEALHEANLQAFTLGQTAAR